MASRCRHTRCTCRERTCSACTARHLASLASLFLACLAAATAAATAGSLRSNRHRGSRGSACIPPASSGSNYLIRSPAEPLIAAALCATLCLHLITAHGAAVFHALNDKCGSLFVCGGTGMPLASRRRPLPLAAGLVLHCALQRRAGGCVTPCVLGPQGWARPSWKRSSALRWIMATCHRLRHRPGRGDW